MAALWPPLPLSDDVVVFSRRKSDDHLVVVADLLAGLNLLANLGLCGPADEVEQTLYNKGGAPRHLGRLFARPVLLQPDPLIEIL